MQNDAEGIRVKRQGSLLRKFSLFGISVRKTRECVSVIVDWLIWLLRPRSRDFWDSHYRLGGTSGPGSFGLLANYKAKFVNEFVHDLNVQSIIDFGCGDGSQLSLLQCPSYVGLEVSRHALARCVQKFGEDGSKSFFIYDPYLFVDNGSIFRAELVISLDVIFHLVEDSVYDKYMNSLFSCAEKYVIIYSSNSSESSGQPKYTRHREILRWVSKFASGWKLTSSPVNPHSDLTMASFFTFEKF